MKRLLNTRSFKTSKSFKERAASSGGGGGGGGGGAGESETDPKIAIQKKVFKRWINSRLKLRGLEVKDIIADWSDGVLLINLMEILSGHSFKYSKEATTEIKKQDNLNQALAFIGKHTKLVNVGSKDVMQGNENIVMGLVWAIVLRWMGESGSVGKEGLMKWLNDVVLQDDYPEAGEGPVTNFSTDFQDGMRFAAIVHAYNPSLIDFSMCTPDAAEDNMEAAFEAAENHMSATRLIDATDVVENAEEKSIIAYLSQLYNHMIKDPSWKKVKRRMPSPEAPLARSPTTNSVTISWVVEPPAVRTRVVILDDSDGTEVEREEFGADVTGHCFSDLKPGRRYRVHLVAIGPAGKLPSQPSGSVPFETEKVPAAAADSSLAKTVTFGEVVAAAGGGDDNDSTDGDGETYTGRGENGDIGTVTNALEAYRKKKASSAAGTDEDIYLERDDDDHQDEKDEDDEEQKVEHEVVQKKRASVVADVAASVAAAASVPVAKDDDEPPPPPPPDDDEDAPPPPEEDEDAEQQEEEYDDEDAAIEAEIEERLRRISVTVAPSASKSIKTITFAPQPVMDRKQALKAMLGQGGSNSGSGALSQEKKKKKRSMVKLNGDHADDEDEDEDDGATGLIKDLPNHTFEVPKLVFRRIEVSKTPATRLAGLMEDVMFSSTSVINAVKWAPSKGDVVIAASPRCGQSLISRMVRLLGAQNKKEFDDIIRYPKHNPPWVECRKVDDDPFVLSRPQPGRRRVFRTCMAYSTLSVSVGRGTAKFVAVFRNPTDLRLAFYHHIREFYARSHERSSSSSPSKSKDKGGKDDKDKDDVDPYQEALDRFDLAYIPDDFAVCPVTLVQIKPDSRPGEYERNLKEWISNRHRENVLVLFLEEALAQPERVLRRLATFLGEELDDARAESILRYTTGKALLSLGRGGSMVLTPEQAYLLELEATREQEAEAEAQGEAAKAALGATLPVRGPLGMLQRFKEANVSQRGIAAGITQTSRTVFEEDLTRRSVGERTPPPAELNRVFGLGLGGKAFGAQGHYVINDFWVGTFGSLYEGGHCVSYAALYEMCTGEPYPLVDDEVLKANRRTLASHVERISVAALASAGKNAGRLVKRLTDGASSITSAIGEERKSALGLTSSFFGSSPSQEGRKSGLSSEGGKSTGKSSFISTSSGGATKTTSFFKLGGR